jgi:hypothetical protein
MISAANDRDPARLLLQSLPVSTKRFFACAGIQKRHGMAAVLCAGGNRDTAMVFQRGGRIAWAQDVYADELQRHRRILQCDDITILGDFASAAEAQNAARAYIGA